jgi:hypothetical protein
MLRSSPGTNAMCSTTAGIATKGAPDKSYLTSHCQSFPTEPWRPLSSHKSIAFHQKVHYLTSRKTSWFYCKNHIHIAHCIHLFFLSFFLNARLFTTSTKDWPTSNACACSAQALQKKQHYYCPHENDWCTFLHGGKQVDYIEQRDKLNSTVSLTSLARVELSNDKKLWKFLGLCTRRKWASESFLTSCTKSIRVPLANDMIRQLSIGTVCVEFWKGSKIVIFFAKSNIYIAEKRHAFSKRKLGFSLLTMSY